MLSRSVRKDNPTLAAQMESAQQQDTRNRQSVTPSGHQITQHPSACDDTRIIRVSQAGAAARRHDPTVLTLRQEDLDEGAEVIGRVIAESHEKEHMLFTRVPTVRDYKYNVINTPRVMSAQTSAVSTVATGLVLFSLPIYGAVTQAGSRHHAVSITTTPQK
jgi:hypothetical protein